MRSRFVVASLVLVLAGCTARIARVVREGPAVDSPRGGILVVAPHPDDEAIMAAGVIARARAEGRRVAIVVVTNGDLSCERDGFRREAESIAAMRQLGVAEGDVYFLGYPDGYLSALGPAPLPPVERLDRDGRCVKGNTTYAARGAGHTDAHSLLSGKPAVYTAEALTSDLTTLVDRLEPTDIYVSHPIDQHLGHVFAYTYLRRALERSHVTNARVHRSLVHMGGCWPMTSRPPPCPEVQFEPREDAPSLPWPITRYRPNELVVVPEAMRAVDSGVNLKFRAIAAYQSQTGPLTPHLSYLFAFVRAREPFFTEQLVREREGLWRSRFASVARGVVAMRAPWEVDETGAHRWCAQRVPLRCSVSDARDTSALEVVGSAEGRYVVRIDGSAVVLERWRASNDDVSVLARWPDVVSGGASRHRIEIAVDPRPDDGGVAEITVRLDGNYLGEAIDPAPLEQGDFIAVRNASPDATTCAP